MSRKEKVRTILPGLTIIDIAKPVLAKPCSVEELEVGINQEQLDSYIAGSIERRFNEITQSSLGHWQAEIQNISFNDSCLLVSIEVPFVLPFDSPYRRDQIRLREGFAEYLFKRDTQKKLSNQFLYPMLVDYLIEAFELKKVNSYIMKRLKKIPQRSLAGRPTAPIPSDMQVRIIQEGKAIFGMLRLIRGQVQEWQKKNHDLTDSTIQKKLRKKYPASKFKWMAHFLKMGAKLPRRRYDASERNWVPSMEVTSPDTKPTPCKLTEPSEWSVVDIATRVTQSHILHETGKRIALQRIKALLR